MKSSWRTVWHGQDILVFQDEIEVDRLHAPEIERVVLVHKGSGDSPGELVHALVELAEACLIFPANTGIAGRVNFERESFWAEKACTYWVSESQASLPFRFRRGRWLSGVTQPIFARLPREELSALMDRWPLQGPQTWQQRKWRRIEMSRPFAPSEAPRQRA